MSPLKREPAMYRRAAELIVESEDPRLAILFVARLETEYQREKRALRSASQDRDRYNRSAIRCGPGPGKPSGTQSHGG